MLFSCGCIVTTLNKRQDCFYCKLSDNSQCLCTACIKCMFTKYTVVHKNPWVQSNTGSSCTLSDPYCKSKWVICFFMRNFTCKLLPKALCILSLMFGVFSLPVVSTHFFPSYSTSMSIIGRKLWQGRLLSWAKRSVNMVWWGMWENSRVHFVHSPVGLPAFQSSI